MNYVMKESGMVVSQLRAVDNPRFLKRLGMIGGASKKKLTENMQIILN